MPTLPVNGRDMAFELLRPAGASEGPPLVLVHGFPLDGRIWADVAQITSLRHVTIIPDLRGFGGSAPGPFTIESLAADVRQLLSELNALPAVVAGLSMGGYVALEFARQFPGDIAGLAPVDTRAGADDESGREKRMQMISLLRESGSGAVISQMLPGLLAPATIAGSPGIVARLRSIMMAVPPETIELALLAMRDRADLRDLLPRLGMPASVIVGQEDAITPPQAAQEMAAALSDAQLIVIEGAGHLSPLERPQQVAAALEGLLKRIR